MSQRIIGKNIKAIRIQSGISQDELAESTQLSLRTIQRIENNETKPRGDSLKKIANALNIHVEELTREGVTKITNAVMKEDKSILLLLNLAAFGYLIYPFLGIIFPMALWIFYKDKVISVDETGKRVMKYQFAWCVIVSTTYVYLIVMKINHISSSIISIQTAIVFIIGLYVLNTIIILLNIFRLSFIKKLGAALQ
jgi:transcriptional regulator with XRE-family HTH domain